jgi:predicted O-methyltransferase YrrM
MDELIMWVNNIDEQNLLINYLKPEHDVLEFGSGMSTLAIAPLVKSLISLEHNPDYASNIENQLPSNAKVVFIPPNIAEYQDDGTFEEFQDYIAYAAMMTERFDVIFIDGRARVECAKIAVNLLKDDGVIFIHDYRHPQPEYRRTEYEVIEEFLDIESFAFAMYKLKPKN